MPHPLAHPAAVLSLRRFCPRWFSFPALVVGSISPDAAYVFVGLKVQEFSHEFIGSIGFCLPAGLLMLWVLHRFRTLAVGLLPGSCQRMLLPLCQRPLGSPLTIVVSLLIGTWAHQFLDSVTHKDGWLVTHSFLDAPLFMYVHQTFRICHCLWYALSFAGIVWVGLVYQRWAAGTAASSKPASDGGPLVNAVLLATSLMLVSACFRVVFHWSGVFLEGALNLFIVVAFLMRTQPDLK